MRSQLALRLVRQLELCFYLLEGGTLPPDELRAALHREPCAARTPSLQRVVCRQATVASDAVAQRYASMTNCSTKAGPSANGIMQRESTLATKKAEEPRLHCLSPLRECGSVRLSTQQFALGLCSVRLSTQQFALGLRLPQGVCKYAALAMATSPVLQHCRVQ